MIHTTLLWSLILLFFLLCSQRPAKIFAFASWPTPLPPPEITTLSHPIHPLTADSTRESRLISEPKAGYKLPLLPLHPFHPFLINRKRMNSKHDPTPPPPHLLSPKKNKNKRKNQKRGKNKQRKNIGKKGEKRKTGGKKRKKKEKRRKKEVKTPKQPPPLRKTHRISKAKKGAQLQQPVLTACQSLQQTVQHNVPLLLRYHTVGGFTKKKQKNEIFFF